MMLLLHLVTGLTAGLVIGRLTVKMMGNRVVSVASRIAALGMIPCSTMKNFFLSSLFRITATLVTSLPVPCVVGIAMCGV